MPTFKVTVQREIVKEITVLVEAETLEELTMQCPSSIIYGSIAAQRPADSWNTVIDDLWFDTDRVERTRKKPEYILGRIDNDWTFEKALNNPAVDPLQLSLLPEDL